MPHTFGPHSAPVETLPLSDLSHIASQIAVARRGDIQSQTTGDGVPEDWPRTDVDCRADRGPYLFDLSPQEETLIDEFLATHPGAKLGHGVARIVLRLDACPGYVVKFGRWGPDIGRSDGRKQNQLEATLYEVREDVLPTSAANCLLPVVAAADSYEWTLQPYAVTLKDGWGYETVFDDPHSHPVQRALWHRAAPLRDKQYASTEGCLPHNIGYWQGRWYILDYGEPKDKRTDVLDRLAEFKTD